MYLCLIFAGVLYLIQLMIIFSIIVENTTLETMKQDVWTSKKEFLLWLIPLYKPIIIVYKKTMLFLNSLDEV